MAYSMLGVCGFHVGVVVGALLVSIFALQDLAATRFVCFLEVASGCNPKGFSSPIIRCLRFRGKCG